MSDTDSNPGFTTGQRPTAAQWNSYFAEKVDVTNGDLTNATFHGFVGGSPVATGNWSFNGSIDGLVTATDTTTPRTLANWLGDVINVWAMRHSGDTDDAPMIQRAIDQAASGGRGAVFIPGGTYSLATSLFVRDNVTVIARSDVFIEKNFYTDANSAIFRNEDFAETVTNFQILGRPTLGTGPDGAGKLVWLICDFARMDIMLGSWIDDATDGFGIAVAGEQMDLNVYGGNPLGTGGLAGIQVFGGSGSVRGVGIKSGDDCIGVFGVRPDVAILGGRSIHDLHVTAVNCESTTGRVVAMGIALTAPFNTATGMEVRNVVATVIGGQSCSSSEFASGTGAGMIICNTNLASTQVHNCSLSMSGVNCNGRAYAGRVINVSDCAIEHRYPINAADSAGFAIDGTTRFRGVLVGDLSTCSNNANVFSCTGTNVQPNLTCNVVVPPRSGAGSAMAFPASGTVTDATLDLTLREVATNNTGVIFGSGATRTNAKVKVYKASGATGTTGLTASASNTGTRILPGSDLSQVDTPYTWNTGVTTGGISQGIPGVCGRKVTPSPGASPYTYGTGIPTTRRLNFSTSGAISDVEVQRFGASGFISLGAPTVTTVSEMSASQFDLVRWSYTGTPALDVFEE